MKSAHTSYRRARLSLHRLLGRAGWDIQRIELDIAGARARVDVRCFRADGLWVWAIKPLRGDGRLERFQRIEHLGRAPDVPSHWPSSCQIEDLFLGRCYTTGARSLMRRLTDYLVDNALEPVTRADMRAAWAPLMCTQDH